MTHFVSSLAPRFTAHLRADLQSLLQGEMAELGAGKPVENLRWLLESLTIDRLFLGKKLIHSTAARCLLSGLWLRHNFLDESHQLSQEIETAEGSYWHAIMHRREPDYSNGKYWFRQIGSHPIFSALATHSQALAQQQPTLDPACQFLLTQTTWNPARFIDLCQHLAQSSTSPGESLARQIAHAEWELLMEWCYGMAVGEVG